MFHSNGVMLSGGTYLFFAGASGHILQPWFLMISRSFHSFPMFGHVPPTGTILKHIAAQVERKGHTKQRNMQICCECAGCSDLITQRAKNKTKHLNTLCWISSSLFLQPTSTVWIMSQKANFRLCFPAQSPQSHPPKYIDHLLVGGYNTPDIYLSIWDLPSHTGSVGKYTTCAFGGANSGHVCTHIIL